MNSTNQQHDIDTDTILRDLQIAKKHLARVSEELSQIEKEFEDIKVEIKPIKTPEPPPDWQVPDAVPYDECAVPPSTEKTWRIIVCEVCGKHGISFDQITRRGYRPGTVVPARQEAFYRLREERLLSLPLIGRLMGGFDHTTVLYGYRAHKKRLESAALLMMLNSTPIVMR